MLTVTVNEARLEYDVHSLVKAFYPQENVKIITPETAEEKRISFSDTVKIRIYVSTEGAEVEIEGREYRWQAEKAYTRAADKKRFKDEWKRFLYEALSGHTGRTLPWGNLTGIRPTKIAMHMLEEGREEKEILAFYEQAHLVSEKKARLSLDIAKREKKLLEGLPVQDGYSLYLGIPFCPTTCLYCSFTSFALGAYRDKTDAYLDCLIREMEDTAKLFHNRTLSTVYIGGGTPTTLEAGQLDRLLGRLRELFDFSTVREFTVEAGRADSITAQKLQALYRHGVTRISVNPQTMKEETLRIIGRRHTVEQVRQAFYLARETGFTNINMDLILGLPGETETDIGHTMEEIIRLAPDSITVHSLAVKRASGMGRWIEENGMELLQNTDGMMRIAAEGAQVLGLQPYYLYRQKNMAGNFENVGYASAGKEGLYNILIMEEKQTIAALGAGSITKAVLPDGRIERVDNVKDVDLYLQKIDELIERRRNLLCSLLSEPAIQG